MDVVQMRFAYGKRFIGGQVIFREAFGYHTKFPMMEGAMDNAESQYCR